jgi:hypothetical protein
MVPERFIDIEVELSDQDFAYLFFAGLIHGRDQAGVLTLTAKGSAWLHEWCAKRIAEDKKDS